MLKIENVKNRNIATICIRGFNEKSNVLIEKFARRGVKAIVDALKEKWLWQCENLHWKMLLKSSLVTWDMIRI